MKNIFSLIILCLLLNLTINAQQPQKLSSAEIYDAIEKLNILGSVLYIAAHPDDENTRLISYFSNDVKARTAYLSLTRGDGGQNLVGPEIRELLGVIRTQELLEARKVDGGEQFFTRANDFGYSKHPDETLTLWNKDEVLNDVVTVIRKFKPDIIINRFNHRTPGSTHGHHTSSAMLSIEAFDLASDINYHTKTPINTWQPKQLYFNTSWWFYGGREQFKKADKSNLISFDVGTYYNSKGLSNNEIAALSRSKHQSQGFGSTGSRGKQLEYLEHLKGNFPKDKKSIFDGIDTSWNRIKGGNEIGIILSKVQNDFDFKNPSASLNDLIKAYKLINNLDDEHWRNLKSKEIKKIIEACAGLYLEPLAMAASTTQNSTIKLNIEAINRSNFNIILKGIEIIPSQTKINKGILLENNVSNTFSAEFLIDSTQKYSTPYWLYKKGTLGMYNAENKYIGLAVTPRELHVIFDLNFNGSQIKIDKNIIYKYNDPVKGEVYNNFDVLPEVSVSLNEKVYIFADNTSQKVTIKVKSGKENLEGNLTLCIPENWRVTPESYTVKLNNKGEEKSFDFELTPNSNQTEGIISPMIEVGTNFYTDELVEIDYNHIPYQTVLMPSEAKVVRLNIDKKGQYIGYIQGAGDEIPTSLRQIGYTVVELKEDEITAEKLKNFDAVVLGIRAYNTNEKSKFYQKTLFDYIEKGGTLITQYNTNFRLKVDQVAPSNLKLSRDRVTDENSVVTILNPDHELVNYPNKITQNDFEGWVQERGLYFPNEWSDKFTPILSMKDKDETPKNGSLLVSKHGKGYFIYTGLSFFRELPAGVSGAYKLFANMVSIGKNNPQEQIKN